VLLDVLRILREMRGGEYDRERLENRLLERGMMSRFFVRFFRLIDASWKTYPSGLLFGFGFDTATEVGPLALAAGVATDTVPLAGILSLPILFAAGMGMRKVYYNITVMWAGSVSIWKLRRIEDRWGG
jgi:high-affinity nickel-transport protein